MNPLHITLLAAAAFALVGCSSTGIVPAGNTSENAASDLASAPKPLKGEIRGSLYTAPDKSFSVIVPHKKKEGAHEYANTQIKEEFTGYGAYVSFGPAAFDESVYRVEAVKDTVSGKRQILMTSPQSSLKTIKPNCKRIMNPPPGKPGRARKP